MRNAELIPDNAISIHNLSITIGDSLILKDVSLDVPKGSITAIIGPSGCGKSTLLKAIVGLVDELGDSQSPARFGGEIVVQGVSVLGLPEDALSRLRREVVYISQQPVIFPGSILENLLVGSEYWYGSEQDANVEQVLRTVSMWNEVKDRLKSPAAILSTGQRQRLTIARALALKPAILLLDEPCANLDPISTSRVEDFLFEVKRDATVLIVTHNMQQAQRTSDFSVLMYMSELVEVNKTDSVFLYPKDKRTEDYISGRFG